MSLDMFIYRWCKIKIHIYAVLTYLLYVSLLFLTHVIVSPFIVADNSVIMGIFPVFL